MTITSPAVIINPTIRVINLFFDSHRKQISQLAWKKEVIYFIIKGN